MATEIIGHEVVDASEVPHGINVDAEALALRNVADDSFQEGRQFAPMMVYFRKGERIAAAVCRPWTDEDDKIIAYTELGMLSPVFRADEVVFAYVAYLNKDGKVNEQHCAISVMAANKIGLTMRTFPFYAEADGSFDRWTEDGSETANYDPFVSTMVGGFVSYEKRPYMLASLIVTLTRKGHAIEVYSKDAEELASKVNA